MPDRNRLGLIGFIYAAVAATVIGVAIFLVANHLDSRLALQPSIVSARTPIGP